MKSILYCATSAMMLGLGLASCDDAENKDIKEFFDGYDQSFTATFGAVSPDQQWNVARRAHLDVSSPVIVDSLSVFAESGTGFYLVAERSGFSGTEVIGFDMPKGYDRLIIGANGRYYAAIADASFDLSTARTLEFTADEDGDDGCYGIVGGYAHISRRPMLWIMGVEDVNVNPDFDFNDVVLGITHVDGRDYAQIYPLAAGGNQRTYIETPVAPYVAISTTDSLGNVVPYVMRDRQIAEYHTYFGTIFDAQCNTYGTEFSFPQPLWFNVAADWTLSFVEGKTNMGNVAVSTEHGYETEQTLYSTLEPNLTPGAIPHMILVTADWWWPRESYQVGTEAYKNVFRSWLKGEDDYNIFWYEHNNATSSRTIIWQYSDLP